jgi:hypothetical protein
MVFAFGWFDTENVVDPSASSCSELGPGGSVKCVDLRFNRQLGLRGWNAYSSNSSGLEKW